jgi:hypothetical protein
MQGFEVRQDGRPYLDRLRILGTPWFSVLLHRIHTPDLDCDPHDHPWAFFSLILSGGYTETIWDRPDELAAPCGECSNPRCENSAHYHPGGVSDSAHEHARRRGSAHLVRLHQAHKITCIDGVLWTLVFTGRRRSSWRFWTRRGPVDWRDYERAGDDSAADRPS